jgi:hypothetical protein
LGSILARVLVNLDNSLRNQQIKLFQYLHGVKESAVDDLRWDFKANIEVDSVTHSGVKRRDIVFLISEIKYNIRS